jgi:galactitol-specific phosphotransferase system IIC component
MSWQLLIWNIFSWTFTGVMIYVTKSSMWWLMLPAVFTMTKSASDLVKAVVEENAKQEKELKDMKLDEETLEEMQQYMDKIRRGVTR